jgi:hypothetical protein
VLSVLGVVSLLMNKANKVPIKTKIINMFFLIVIQK